MSWSDIENNSSSGQEKKVPYTTFAQGATLIRVIDDEPYSFWSHWLTKQNTSVTCPGKDCPICSIIQEQKANKVERTYNSSQRHAIKIWNYNTNQMEVMIQGKKFFSNLLTLHREVGNLKDYDVKVVRTGEGTETNYIIVPTQPKEFEKMDKCEEVDYAELFKAPETEVILQLMEGKSYAEIYGTEEK